MARRMHFIRAYAINDILSYKTGIFLLKSLPQADYVKNNCYEKNIGQIYDVLSIGRLLI